MCRGVSSLGLFALFVDIGTRLAIETHAAKLHGSTIHRIVSWHDHCLLLLEHAALVASAATLWTSKTVRAGSKSAQCGPANGSLVGRKWGEVARIDRAGGAGDGLCSRRVRLVWEVLNVCFCQWIL